MVIYKITNLVNGKIYIGQTVQSLNDRLNHHFRASPATPLYRAHKKYGRKNFTIEEIDRAENIDELNEKEVYWIAFYKSTEYEIGYNLMSGGGNKGRHSEESKKKMSESHKNMSDETRVRISRAARNISEETRQKMREAKKGKKLTEEHKAKIVRVGYKWTEESKKKSSETQKGREFTEEHRKNMSEAGKRKPKTQYQLDNLKRSKGRITTPESRERYKQAALKREAKRREKNGEEK